MKKIIVLLLILILGLICAGCSSENTPKISPEVLGYAVLQQEDSLFYVDIDTVHYPVTSLLIKATLQEPPVRTQALKAHVGSDITCFTTPNWKETQFLQGKFTESQIEDLYHQESLSGSTLVKIIAFWVVVWIFWSMQKPLRPKD